MVSVRRPKMRNEIWYDLKCKKLSLVILIFFIFFATNRIVDVWRVSWYFLINFSQFTNIQFCIPLIADFRWVELWNFSCMIHTLLCWVFNCVKLKTKNTKRVLSILQFYRQKFPLNMKIWVPLFSVWIKKGKKLSLYASYELYCDIPISLLCKIKSN